MKNGKWACEQVRRSISMVSESNMKLRLAEVVEVLSNSKCQLKPILATTPRDLLIGRPNKRGRR